MEAGRPQTHYRATDKAFLSSLAVLALLMDTAAYYNLLFSYSGFNTALISSESIKVFCLGVWLTWRRALGSSLCPLSLKPLTGVWLLFLLLLSLLHALANVYAALPLILSYLIFSNITKLCIMHHIYWMITSQSCKMQPWSIWLRL